MMGAISRRTAVVGALMAASLGAPAATQAAQPVVMAATPELASSLPLDAAAPRTDWWAGLDDPLLD